jgi:hypothetical protein
MLQSIYPEIQNFMPQAISGGTFQSLATLQAQSTTQGPTGNPLNTFANVTGLINIPCMDAPPSMARVQATEVKAVSEIMSKGMRHVLLNQCFPDAINWSSYGYRCVVDGVTYDLLGAENDSQLTQTRLDMQLVTV